MHSLRRDLARSIDDSHQVKANATETARLIGQIFGKGTSPFMLEIVNEARDSFSGYRVSLCRPGDTTPGGYINPRVTCTAVIFLSFFIITLSSSILISLALSSRPTNINSLHNTSSIASDRASTHL